MSTTSDCPVDSARVSVKRRRPRRGRREDVEVIGGNQGAVDALGFAEAGDRHVIVVVGEEAGKGLGVVAKVGVVGIREGRGRVLVARAASDGDHVAGVGRAGNRVEERGADPAEDGGVGSDR